MFSEKRLGEVKSNTASHSDKITTLLGYWALFSPASVQLWLIAPFSGILQQPLVNEFRSCYQEKLKTCVIKKKKIVKHTKKNDLLLPCDFLCKFSLEVVRSIHIPLGPKWLSDVRCVDRHMHRL